MREIRTSGSEGGVRFDSSFLPLFNLKRIDSKPNALHWALIMSRRWRLAIRVV